MEPACVYLGDDLGRYGFGHGHPFGPDRLRAFENAFKAQGLDRRVEIRKPVQATRQQILSFHTPEYVERVEDLSKRGSGFLDYGDTPAFPGVFEAAAFVVGSVLDAVDHLCEGASLRAFVPIAGLHHARRHTAGGFCVFNDCGVAIGYLRAQKQISRVGYVDIDAHHGDGVFYSFEDDADVIFADLHEDGHYLYPGTGFAHETGCGPAKGTKLNIPLPPGAGDDDFLEAWTNVEAHLERFRPEFILFQCGADSLAGDPITHLRYSEAAHAHAARRLREIADRHARGRLLALGGGGYNHANIAKAWTAVVRELSR